MPVERNLPTAEARELLALTGALADKELRPRAAADEQAARFPRDIFTTLGRAGLLGLPYPEEYGGGEQPYEVYLQVVEELASGWLAVGLGVSVHTLSAFPTFAFGTDQQKQVLLPGMVGGELLGAYCLSESGSGSDAAALTTTALREDDGYHVRGTKAWVTHGGVADYYNLFARTGGPGSSGISTFLVDADTRGLAAQPAEHKMGMSSSPTAQIVFDDAVVDPARLLGEEGQGFRIALAALDGGRLGIAACAVGVAQAALDYAVAYAQERQQFGRAIVEFQGLAFLLADMATSVAAARALYLDAARRRDAGRPYGPQAAMAKLFASDMVMRVTIDAVQVLGGAGYLEDHPTERWLREAKVLQIVEGTNQVQRIVISRSLGGDSKPASIAARNERGAEPAQRPEGAHVRSTS